MGEVRSIKTFSTASGALSLVSTGFSKQQVRIRDLL